MWNATIGKFDFIFNNFFRVIAIGLIVAIFYVFSYAISCKIYEEKEG